MATSKITDEELYQFRSLPVQKKIDSMEAYLIGYDGYRYNMHEVGEMVFGHENNSFTVSLIHRCYNFSGNNSGKYAPGCVFEKKYGYRVTRKDIEAFVMKYPNGTADLGVTFEDFLKTRINSAKTQKPKPQSIQRPDFPQFNSPNNNSYNYENKQELNGEGLLVFIGVALASLLVLGFLLFTGNLLRYWKISLIALLFAIGGFSAPALLNDDSSRDSQESFAEDDYYDYQDYGDGYTGYNSYGNRSGIRGAGRTHKMSRPINSGAMNFNILDFLRGKSLSSILTGILVFVLISKIIISVITHEPISTRFWSLYIAIAVTKGMIFDEKNLGLFGKLFFMWLVWLVAYNFM